MKSSKLQNGDLDDEVGGALLRCEDGAGCGLRFPVALHDHFANCCPRCQGPVRLVAQVSGRETAAVELAGPSAATASNLRLLLDNWRSTFNVGAAFRTADGAGISHLYLCG